MNHELIARFIEQTLVLGSLYTLVGIGFVILFRSTGVVNFAQGSFMVLGAYFFYSLLVQLQLPFWVAAAGSLIGVGLIGALLYALMFHRMVGADLFVIVVATMGLAVAVQTVTLLIWGPQIRELPEVIPSGPVAAPFGVAFTRLDLLAIVASAILIVALEIALQRTTLGIRMRAVADSVLLAALSRVDVHVFSGLAWSISALCAGAAGVAVALRTAVDPTNIGQLGLLIFPVVIIGGVDSMRGALVGGLLVAATQNLTILVFGGTWVDPIAYALLLLMLLVRPRGFFGTREIVRI